MYEHEMKYLAAALCFYGMMEDLSKVPQLPNIWSVLNREVVVISWIIRFKSIINYAEPKQGDMVVYSNVRP